MKQDSALQPFAKIASESLVFACLFLAGFAFVPSLDLAAQEFSPNEKHETPEFTTAMIKEGVLRFTSFGDFSALKTEVIEVGVPRKKEFKRPISVQVPYIVERSGEQITVYRTETKYETVVQTVIEPKLKTRQVPVKSKGMVLNEVSLRRDTFEFSTIKGVRLNHKMATEKLAQWSPAVILRDGETLSPYFKKLLNPETILLIEKKRVRRPVKKTEKPSPQN